MSQRDATIRVTVRATKSVGEIQRQGEIIVEWDQGAMGEALAVDNLAKCVASIAGLAYGVGDGTVTITQEELPSGSE